jgi:hypothetical protein
MRASGSNGKLALPKTLKRPLGKGKFFAPKCNAMPPMALGFSYGGRRAAGGGVLTSFTECATLIIKYICGPRRSLPFSSYGLPFGNRLGSWLDFGLPITNADFIPLPSLCPDTVAACLRRIKPVY